jgi:hypothetical protein
MNYGQLSFIHKEDLNHTYLNPLSHCHFEVELPVPELGQVTALLE